MHPEASANEEKRLVARGGKQMTMNTAGIGHGKRSQSQDTDPERSVSAAEATGNGDEFSRAVTQANSEEAPGSPLLEASSIGSETGTAHQTDAKTDKAASDGSRRASRSSCPVARRL